MKDQNSFKSVVNFPSLLRQDPFDCFTQCWLVGIGNIVGLLRKVGIIPFNSLKGCPLSMTWLNPQAEHCRYPGPFFCADPYPLVLPSVKCAIIALPGHSTLSLPPRESPELTWLPLPSMLHATFSWQ